MRYRIVKEGPEGNAFFIMGYVAKAMKKEGFEADEIDEYLQDAKSKDYAYLLAVSEGKISVCNFLHAKRVREKQ